MIDSSWTDKKLLHLNKLYIAQILSLEELKSVLKPFLQDYLLWQPEFENSEWFDRVITALRLRAFTLLDIVENFRCFHDKEFDYYLDVDAVNKRIFNNSVDIINLFLPLAQKLNAFESFTANNIESLLRNIAEKESIKLGMLCNAIRVVITGQSVGAGLFEILELIGKEKVVFRIEKVANDDGYLLWLAENNK